MPQLDLYQYLFVFSFSMTFFVVMMLTFYLTSKSPLSLNSVSENVKKLVNKGNSKAMMKSIMGYQMMKGYYFKEWQISSKTGFLSGLCMLLSYISMTCCFLLVMFTSYVELVEGVLSSLLSFFTFMMLMAYLTILVILVLYSTFVSIKGGFLTNWLNNHHSLTLFVSVACFSLFGMFIMGFTFWVVNSLTPHIHAMDGENVIVIPHDETYSNLLELSPLTCSHDSKCEFYHKFKASDVMYMSDRGMSDIPHSCWPNSEVNQSLEFSSWTCPHDSKCEFYHKFKASDLKYMKDHNMAEIPHSCWPNYETSFYEVPSHSKDLVEMNKWYKQEVFSNNLVSTQMADYVIKSKFGKLDLSYWAPLDSFVIPDKLLSWEIPAVPKSGFEPDNYFMDSNEQLGSVPENSTTEMPKFVFKPQPKEVEDPDNMPSCSRWYSEGPDKYYTDDMEGMIHLKSSEMTPAIIAKDEEMSANLLKLQKNFWMRYNSGDHYCGEPKKLSIDSFHNQEDFNAAVVNKLAIHSMFNPEFKPATVLNMPDEPIQPTPPVPVVISIFNTTMCGLKFKYLLTSGGTVAVCTMIYCLARMTSL